MARVSKLQEREQGRTSVHQDVDATYHVFEIAGEIYLQIDTYGSPERAFPAKVSQSLQFGPEGIDALRKILSKLP
ncbi:hypothetical protein AB4874_01555 [Thioclava sp. 15-R06ZXC-3]|uniref:Methionyl-tRNA formyltransferase n=1 Tax=Thioclava arctica TaxID=3238301 RepID=A0ABV3TFD1_9RHOB